MGDSESKPKEETSGDVSPENVTTSSVTSSSTVESSGGHQQSSTASYESYSKTTSSKSVSSREVVSSSTTSSSHTQEESSRGGGVLVANSKEQELERQIRNENIPEAQMIVTGVSEGNRIVSGLSDTDAANVKSSNAESSHVQISTVQSFAAESWSGEHKTKEESINASSTGKMTLPDSCLLITGFQDGHLLLGGFSALVEHHASHGDSHETAIGSSAAAPPVSGETATPEPEHHGVKEEVLVASSLDTVESSSSGVTTTTTGAVSTNEHELVSGLMYGAPLVSGITQPLAGTGEDPENPAPVMCEAPKLFEAEPWSGTHGAGQEENASEAGVPIVCTAPPTVEVIPSTPVSPPVDEMMAQLASGQTTVDATPPATQQNEPAPAPVILTNTNEHTLVQGLQEGEPIVAGIVPAHSDQPHEGEFVAYVMEEHTPVAVAAPPSELPKCTDTPQQQPTAIVNTTSTSLVQGLHEGHPIVGGVTVSAPKTPAEGDEVEMLMKSLETTNAEPPNSADAAAPGGAPEPNAPGIPFNIPEGAQSVEMSYERKYHKTTQERTYASGDAGPGTPPQQPASSKFIPVILGMFNGHLVCAGLGIPGTSTQPDSGAPGGEVPSSFMIHQKPEDIQNHLGQLTDQLQNLIQTGTGGGQAEISITSSHKSTRTVMEREITSSKETTGQSETGGGAGDREADEIIKQLEEQMSNLPSSGTGGTQQQQQTHYHHVQHEQTQLQQQQAQQQQQHQQHHEQHEHNSAFQHVPNQQAPSGGLDADSVLKQVEQQFNPSSFGGAGGMKIEMSSHRSHKSSKKTYEVSGSGASEEEVERKLQEQLQNIQAQEKQPSPSRIPAPVSQSHAESSFEQVVSPDGNTVMTKRSHKTVITSTSRSTTQKPVIEIKQSAGKGDPQAKK